MEGLLSMGPTPSSYIYIVESTSKESTYKLTAAAVGRTQTASRLLKHCSTLHCMQHCALHAALWAACSTVHCSTLQFHCMQDVALHAAHFNTACCTAAHCTACRTLHYSTLLQCSRNVHSTRVLSGINSAF